MDPQMVPQMVAEVVYPWSTSVSVEPCGSQNLACSSYDKLRYVRSSSAFPAIGRVVVDSETATNMYNDDDDNRRWFYGC